MYLHIINCKVLGLLEPIEVAKEYYMIADLLRKWQANPISELTFTRRESEELRTPMRRMLKDDKYLKYSNIKLLAFQQKHKCLRTEKWPIRKL